MKKVIVAIIGIILIGAYLLTQWVVDEPQIVVEYVEIPIPVEVIKEVEVIREVEVLREIEVIKEVPKELREFESLQAFEAWYEAGKPPYKFFGTIDLDNPKLDPRWDCDDFADWLQRRAYNDGYLMSLQLAQGGRVMGKQVYPFNQDHMGNLIMIGNDIYYVEPQPRHYKVILVAIRD